MNTEFESTYALLVRSEEKGRTLLETAFYTLFILSALVCVWQFGLHPVTIPAGGIQPSPEIVSHIATDSNCGRS